MKSLAVWITALMLFAMHTGISAFAEGASVGNGGDAIYCYASEQNNFSGYYTLDYIVASAEIQKHPSSDEALDAIEEQFQKKIPQLAESLSVFREAAQKSSKISDRYYWKPDQNGILSIEDEQLKEKLPRNCMDKSNPNKVNLIQLVRRLEQGNQIKFFYDSAVMDKIRNNGNQYSWILVHEWLWNFFDNAESIRQFNEYLHSVSLKQDGKSKINRLVQNLTAHLRVVPIEGLYQDARRMHCPVAVRSNQVRKTVEFSQLIYGLGSTCTYYLHRDLTPAPCSYDIFDKSTICGGMRITGQSAFEDIPEANAIPDDLKVRFLQTKN